MAACRICQSSDFVLLNGTYFCRMCQTSSQDLREEKNEELQSFTIGQHQFKLKIQDHKREEKLSQKQKGKDFGIKWTTCDAFNIILKELVSVLIQFGISSQLKIVVQHLWFLYLKKTEYAFCKDFSGRGWISKLPTFARERDIQVLQDNAMEIVAKKFRANYYKTRKTQLRNTKKKMANRSAPSRKRKHAHTKEVKKKNIPWIVSDNCNDENSFPIHGMDSVQEDKDNPIIGETNESLVPSDDTKDQNNTRTHLKRKKKSYNRVQKKQKEMKKTTASISKMTMKRILEFLFLGLLLVDKSILLCDLLKWIKENWLPLREAVKFLPDQMKFQTYDNSYFRMLHIPSNQNIRLETAKLARFLDIFSIPSKSLQEISARFILELNLPEQFLHLIHNLILLNPPRMTCYPSTTTRRVMPIPNYEGRALAYIIVLFKLLLGLDGKTEKKQSQFGRKLASVLTEENPFIWDEWVIFINGRKLMLEMYHVDENLQALNTEIDPNKIVNNHHILGLKTRGRRSDLTPHRKAYFRESVRNTVREPIKVLSGEIEIEEDYIEKVTSFSFSSKAREIFNKTDKIPSDVMKDFRSTSVQCYIDPNTLREKLLEKEFNLIVKQTSAWTSKKHKHKTKDSETYNNLVKGKISNSNLNDIPVMLSRFGSTESLIKNSSPLEDHFSNEEDAKQLIVYQPYREYNIHHYWKNVKGIYDRVSLEMAPSLRWLINLCSEVGCMEPEALYFEVMLIERVLIYKRAEKTKRQKLAHNLFVNRCW